MIFTTQDMFVYVLGYTRNLERMGDRMLGDLASRIQEPELPQLLHDEQDTRYRQTVNFDACLTSLEVSPLESSAPFAEALREEFFNFARRNPSPVALEIFAIGTALRFAYVVIAGYKELVGLAESLGEWECLERMQDNLTHKQRYADRLESRGRDVAKRLAAEVENARSM